MSVLLAPDTGSRWVPKEGDCVKYWVSCSRFSVQVNTDERGTIIWAAPIVRRFIGQPLGNLVRWASASAIPLDIRQL